MSLREPWRDLDRSATAAAPDRYGVYELGDADGKSLDHGVGVLRDEVKEAVAYGDAAKIRWAVAESRDHAERLVAEHF